MNGIFVNIIKCRHGCKYKWAVCMTIRLMILLISDHDLSAQVFQKHK